MNEETEKKFNDGSRMARILSLAKRRGFIFPSSEIYGGLANAWDYGPLGVELKNNIKQLWWKHFIHDRDDIVGLDAAIIMNPKVWEASGHTKNFIDPLVECTKCKKRFRADEVFEENEEFHKVYREKDGKTIDISAKDLKSTLERGGFKDLGAIKLCPEKCGGTVTDPRQFNLMFKTFFGPVEDENSTVYLRPETAQAMFVDFKSVVNTSRKKIPFGIGQIGKAFRNEITPGNFIFRTREFEQMEIEYFIRPDDWEAEFEKWRKEMRLWMKDIGIDEGKIHEVEIPEGERAHYSKRTIDFEYEFPFGQKELYGLAYRGDFDLKNHFPQAPPYRDPETNKEFWPHVIEPTWGVDRTMLVLLLDAYKEEGERIVLKLKPELAPIKVAVFPLLANKPELVEMARKLYDALREKTSAALDDRGNIGKRYYAQDEIGTPFCLTVDFQSLEDNTVTVRERDTMKQERMSVAEIEELRFLKIRYNGSVKF